MCVFNCCSVLVRPCRLSNINNIKFQCAMVAMECHRALWINKTVVLKKKQFAATLYCSLTSPTDELTGVWNAARWFQLKLGVGGLIDKVQHSYKIVRGFFSLLLTANRRRRAITQCVLCKYRCNYSNTMDDVLFV